MALGESQASVDKILFLLKTHGPDTSKGLAQRLKMTSMGARQHLLQLEQQGVVESYSRAEKVGRPSQYWQLTSLGHQRFPDGYEQLSTNLLSAARSVFGDEGVSKLIQQRERDNLVRYQLAMADCNTLDDKLDVLVALRNAEGYMAQWYAEGESYWLLENHCPICSAAKTCQQFCQSELALFEQCLGTSVRIRREEHIVQGARRCAYKINTV